MKFKQTGFLKLGLQFGVYLMLTTGAFVCSITIRQMIQAKTFRIEAIVVIVLAAFFFVCIAMFSSCFFPSWEICEHGFQIHALFLKTNWLNWSDIIAVRLGPRGIYMIRIDRLPWPYIWQGFSYGLGGRTLLLSPTISNYETLIETLKAQRSDLFG